MAVAEKRYITVSDTGALGGTIHTQIDCNSFRQASVPELVTINEQDDILYAEYRGTSRQVEECQRCQPALEWHWQDDAACTGKDLNMIDPTHPEDVLIFCISCPVRLQCGEFALSRADEATGIWGGIFIPMSGNGHRDGITRLKRECAILRSVAA